MDTYPRSLSDATASLSVRLYPSEFHIVIEARDLEIVHREIFLHFVANELRRSSEAGSSDTAAAKLSAAARLFARARCRDRKAHLSHLCLGHFQTRIISERIGRKERQPVLISLRGLNQSAGGAFEEERVGDSEFRKRKKRLNPDKC